MADEKDRFGDKMRDKERGHEDQYFAKRDRELIAKLRQQKDAERVKLGGSGECPKCSTRLEHREVHGILVDECPGCSGVWAERDQLEALARRSERPGNWLARLLQIPTRS
jgi:hypothetical protein